MSFLLPGHGDLPATTYHLSSAVHFASNHHYTAFLFEPTALTDPSKSAKKVWQFNSFPVPKVISMTVADFEQNFANSLELVAYEKLY